MKRLNLRRAVIVVSVAIAAAACATPVAPSQSSALGFKAPDVSDVASRERSAQRLDRVLSNTQSDSKRFALDRFWASYFLTQLHHRAAFERPFLTEPESYAKPRASGRDFERRRPSATAHLVATIDHATRATGLFVTAREAGVPSELAPLTLDEVRSDLDFSLTTSYSRLGFQSEVRARLERLPEVLDSKSCEALFDRQFLSAALRPWVCEMMSVHLRTSDELEAYRFAILAIEGRERFGSALPSGAVRALEDWILSGASVRFVCPRSQTDYVRGRRHSPVSGIAHLDYVPVERNRLESSGASRVL